MPDSAVHLIGLISDTHGLVRRGVHEALKGVELILHAGDVGGTEILDELRLIAPTRAVSGNTDPPGDPSLTQRIDIEVDGVRIHVSHGHEVGSPTPDKLAAQYDAEVVVYGHSHQQLVTRFDNRLFVNPGSAGARRFNLLPSVARLTIAKGKAEVEIIELA
ncbi:MAG TPA: metallophosphoesterase family protein [Gemmatimonadaceae bacterium]|jgi:putative phosphoesterase|nr:metallophosphoesterase family protein [Gemmatimonadaceae bacterium]